MYTPGQCPFKGIHRPAIVMKRGSQCGKTSIGFDHCPDLKTLPFAHLRRHLQLHDSDCIVDSIERNC